MKPLGVIGILDQTIKLYRSNFKAFILFVLLIGGTANLIVSLIQLGAGITVLESPLQNLLAGQFTLDTLVNSFGAAQPNWLASLLSILVAIFINPLVTGGVVFVALAASHGKIEQNYLSRVSSKYGKLVRTFLALMALLAGFVLAAVIILLIFAYAASTAGIVVAAIALCVLGLVALLICAFAFPVAVQEDRYGFTWLPRAWRLFKSKAGKTVGLLLLTYLLVMVLELILQMIFTLLPPLISTIGTVLVGSLLEPIPLIAVALLYLDIRMRTEGYDLEIRLASLKNAEEISTYE
jgi:hypothetical protein